MSINYIFSVSSVSTMKNTEVIMERQELSDLIRGESKMAGMYKAAVYSPLVATIAGCAEKDSDYLAMGGMVAVGALVVGGLYAAVRNSYERSQRRDRNRRGSFGGYSNGLGSSSNSTDLDHRVYDDSSTSFWSFFDSGSGGYDGGSSDCGGDSGGGDGGCGGGD